MIGPAGVTLGARASADHAVGSDRRAGGSGIGRRSGCDLLGAQGSDWVVPGSCWDHGEVALGSGRVRAS